MSLVLNQKVQVHEGKTWFYGVVEEIYDDRYVVCKENGYRTMVIIDEEQRESETGHIDDRESVVHLYKDGKPVIVKKSLFGKYKF